MSASLELLRSQIKVNQDYLDLIELRFVQGLASALDVQQQKSQIAAIQAQIPNVLATIEVLKHQLAVLTGRSPADFKVSIFHGMDSLPDLPDVGIPADLLIQRPDIRAAKARVVAVDHRLAAAIADWLPSLTLNASTGFMAQDITKLFTSWIWNLGASLLGTIWDGGRMLAEQNRLKAQLKEMIAIYGQVVLTALQEVEDALIRNRMQQEYVKRLKEQLKALRDSLDTAMDRYKNGLIDYLPVLTALKAVQQIERGLISANAQALVYRVQLCRALGGSWTSQLHSGKDKLRKGE
jgi:NodT family efflux transporter outer membrane factor (OMF) lipoprotein